MLDAWIIEKIRRREDEERRRRYEQPMLEVPEDDAFPTPPPSENARSLTARVREGGKDGVGQAAAFFPLPFFSGFGSLFFSAFTEPSAGAAPSAAGCRTSSPPSWPAP